MVYMTRIYFHFLWLIGIGKINYGRRVPQDPAVSFRTSSSRLEYTFPKTETSTKVVIDLGFTTSKCDGKILDIPSRETRPQLYYALRLVPPGHLLFDYHLIDGRFLLKLNSSGIGSFCDGRRHHVHLRRKNREIHYKVDNGEVHKHVEYDIVQKPSLSKPDGIFIGGDEQEKFIGCIYVATVEVLWSKLPISKVDLIQMYLDGDAKVSGRDLFVDACVAINAECKPSKEQIDVTKPHGSIASPFSLENVTTCTWVLAAPLKHRIKLQLLLLRANGSYSCANNYVEILEGSNTSLQLLGRYCNPKLQSPHNRPIYSEGRFLTVVLTSNSSDNIDFLAKYDSASLSEGPCPVRAKLTGRSGTFTTPDFPFDYGRSRKCTWIIEVPRGKHVLIAFKKDEFDIDGCSDNCECDYMEIGLEHKGRISSSGRYCGHNTPLPIYLASGRVLVEFSSDHHESRRGFKATYSIIQSLGDQCSSYKILQNRSGTITSPRFPRAYPGDMDCLWIIKGPPNTRVRLSFTSILHLDFACKDYVEVTDGATKGTQTFVKKLCISPDIPQEIVSLTTNLFVRFVTDKYQQYKFDRIRMGFTADFEIISKVSGSQVLKLSILLLAVSVNIPFWTRL